MTFARLIRPDWVAFAAALVLLLVMALDWYSTVAGDEARRIEEIAEPEGALGGEVERRLDDDARVIAEDAERNAWQADAVADRIVLIALLAAIAAAISSAFLRAAGRRFEPPASPAGMAAVCAGVAALAVTYRIFQEPGFDDATTLRSGPPLALALLGVMALAAAAALRAEESGEAWRPDEPPADDGSPSVESPAP